MALESLKKITEITIQDYPQKEIEETEEIIPKTKWLVFYINDRKFAVKGNEVQNIVKTASLYEYPFAPVFVEGVINFHSRIFPVINYEKMINRFSKNEEAPLYVILKAETEVFALVISGVDDFYMIADEDYSDLSEDVLQNTENTETANFINGNITLNIGKATEKIPVINVFAINQNIKDCCGKEMWQ